VKWFSRPAAQATESADIIITQRLIPGKMKAPKLITQETIEEHEVEGHHDM